MIDENKVVLAVELSLFKCKDLGPVVKNFVSLTLSFSPLSFSPQFVNYISTAKANTLLFFVEKNVRILCSAKDSHIFSTKNNSVFVILPFEILTNR